jgi:Flp pilus assembly protein protease CpaA
MFLKIVGILIASVALAFAGYQAFAIPFFVVARGIAFVIESGGAAAERMGGGTARKIPCDA